jgi:hypothetical protein
MVAYGVAARPDGRGCDGFVERRRETTPSGPTWAGVGKISGKENGLPPRFGLKGDLGSKNRIRN